MVFALLEVGEGIDVNVTEGQHLGVGREAVEHCTSVYLNDASASRTGVPVRLPVQPELYAR